MGARARTRVPWRGGGRGDAATRCSRGGAKAARTGSGKSTARHGLLLENRLPKGGRDHTACRGHQPLIAFRWTTPLKDEGHLPVTFSLPLVTHSTSKNLAVNTCMIPSRVPSDGKTKAVLDRIRI